MVEVEAVVAGIETRKGIREIVDLHRHLEEAEIHLHHVEEGIEVERNMCVQEELAGLGVRSDALEESEGVADPVRDVRGEVGRD